MRRHDLQVFLSPTSFLSISVAAAEVYPRETVGILIGLQGKDKIWVEYAVPVQSADRDKDSVSWKSSVDYRIKEFMTGSTGLEVVGGFHSHPWPERKFLFKGMNRLSPEDISTWNPREIEIVSGLVKNGGKNEKGKKLNWVHVRGGTLQGAIGNYAMKVTAWFSVDSVRKDPQIAFIRCPFATGMER